MDVCITQHKEEDVYNHMVKMYKRMEEIFEKYKAVYDKIIKVDLDSDTNIYTKYNWRQGDPSRFWKKNANRWYFVDVAENDHEQTQTEWFQIYQIWADFMICDNKDHGHDWLSEKEDWQDMVHEVNTMHGFMTNTFETIELYEKMAYHEAKQEWLRIDRAWIEENDRKKEHTKHPSIELPSPTNHEKIPEPYLEQPLRDDCIYCKQHWEEMKPKYERAVQIWSQNKQEWDEYQAEEELKNQKNRKQREQKAKEYDQWQARQDPMNLHCEQCEYEAEDDDDLDQHNETEEHKEKLRFCKCCNLQCSSEYAYKNHLETTKHKKNAGLIDNGPKVYKCKDCDYETITKANFERHCYSKHKVNK
jgi:hypothetical protein